MGDLKHLPFCFMLLKRYFVLQLFKEIEPHSLDIFIILKLTYSTYFLLHYPFFKKNFADFNKKEH